MGLGFVRPFLGCAFIVMFQPYSFALGGSAWGLLFALWGPLWVVSSQPLQNSVAFLGFLTQKL